MNDNKMVIKQWLTEKEEWKQLLSLCFEKSFGLKIKLVKLIRKIDGHDRIMLEKLEQIQNRLLQTEQALQLLRVEISEHEKFLRFPNEKFPVDNLLHIAEDEHEKLKREVQICENNCYLLAADFNHLLEDKVF